MKTKTFLLVFVMLAANASLSVVEAQQNQSVLDVLRSIQPGQPASAPAQPAPVAVPQPTPVTPSQPAPALDTKPVFMSIVTNYFLVTNRVIVTNLVVATNFTYTTNYYNAQGQLMTMLQPAPVAAATAAPKPAAIDPAVVRSNQVRVVRDLLVQSLIATSNTVAAPGGFSNDATIQIRMPEGITVFDRKKGQALTTAMNQAAEKAAPVACASVQKAVAQLAISDPAQVLQVGGDAATRLLVTAEGQNVANQILAAVQTSATEARVSEAYNAVMLRGGGLLGAVLGTAPSVDINAHITRGLMEAIFTKMAAEENRIRTDPTARKTRTLRDGLPK